MINLETWLPFTVTIGDSDGAQTNLVLSPAFDNANQWLEVIDLYVNTDAATSAATAIRIAFGASSLPAAALTPVRGVLFEHSGLSSGMHVPGIPGRGKPGEELRCACEDPSGGSISISFLCQIKGG